MADYWTFANIGPIEKLRAGHTLHVFPAGFFTKGELAALEKNHDVSSFEEPDGSVYLYSESGAFSFQSMGDDCATIAAIMQEALQRNDNGQILGVFINMAHTCSRPRLDAFGGGAYVITKHGIEETSTLKWIVSEAAKIRGDNQ